MSKTIAFVTSQYCCDRIIHSASVIASKAGAELIVVGILDCEYSLNPEVIDYLFELSKKNKATMRLIFSDNKVEYMQTVVSQEENANIVTGMPSNNQSVLYALWKEFPEKAFYTVDKDGEVCDVASHARSVRA